MRKIFLTISFLAMSTMMWAVPAKRGVWKTVKLTDGTEVRVELRGDEHINYWQTESGERYIKAADSEYYVVADMEALEAKAVESRSAAPLRGRQRVSIGDVNHPAFVGSKKGLIILVNFTDVKFKPEHDADYYSHLANDVNFTSADGHVGSIHDYFLAQSEGQFDLTFDVVGPIELSHEMAYYGGRTDYTNDKNPGAMISEAVTGAVMQLKSFDKYDWFNDGNVDQVFVLYAGYGEATGGGDDTIWPHRSSIGRMFIGGKYVSTYACSNELNIDGSICGIGTFCHEFSHCLGLPDLYDVSYSGNYGMNSWDLMDQGCYNGSGYMPCSYSGYERNFCGWKQPIELTADTHVEGVKGISEGGDYYIIKNDAYTNEYYILENRTKTGWDEALTGSGMLVTYVDFDQNLWEANMVNALSSTGWFMNDHQRYTPFLADNNTTTTQAGVAGDLYPFYGNNLIANNSYPASTLHHANTDGNYYMSKPVRNIMKNIDGTISFDFANEVGKNNDVELPDGVFFKETFDQSAGIGGNDGKWRPTEDESTVIICDNLGWEFFDGSLGADKCVVASYYALTPEITITDDSELSLRTGFIVSSGRDIMLTVESGDVTLGENTFKMGLSKWTDFTTTLTASSYPAKCRIRFEVVKNSFFIDEVTVAQKNVTAVTNITTDNGTQKGIYTVDGRFVGYDLNKLEHGLYILGGKKIIK